MDNPDIKHYSSPDEVPEFTGGRNPKLRPKPHKPHKKPKQKNWHKGYIILIIIVLVIGGIVGTVAYVKHHNHEIWLAKQPKCSKPSIKGNISYRTGVKIYHAPWDNDYNRTVIDTSAGERWFCTTKDAEAAGWRHTQAY